MWLDSPGFDLALNTRILLKVHSENIPTLPYRKCPSNLAPMAPAGEFRREPFLFFFFEKYASKFHTT